MRRAPAPPQRPPRPRRAWLAAFVLVLATVAPVGSFAADAPAERLADVRARIDGTLAELEEVADRAEESEEAVAAAETTVARLEEELNEVLAAVVAQEQEVAAAQAEADEAEAERDRVEGVASNRARRAFMGGMSNDLMVLSEVGGDDLEGALDRLAYLDAIAARDRAAIESLDAVRTRADAAAARLDEALADLEEARSVQEELLADAEEVFAAREDALADLQGQEERLLAQQERLEAEEDEVQEIIRREEERRRAAEEAARRAAQEAARQRAEEEASSASDAGDAGNSGGSAPAPEPEPEPDPPAPPPSSSGCYSWPAGGGVTSEFGYRWGRLHAGMDIDGNTGDAIYAAQSGTVISVGWQGGYGQLTLISHGDGVTTAYAHQSSVSVSSGQSVSRGQYIGAIGTTGNVTGSHLHFETRTSGGAVNPRNYLC